MRSMSEQLRLSVWAEDYEIDQELQEASIQLQNALDRLHDSAAPTNIEAQELISQPLPLDSRTLLHTEVVQCKDGTVVRMVDQKEDVRYEHALVVPEYGPFYYHRLPRSGSVYAGAPNGIILNGIHNISADEYARQTFLRASEQVVQQADDADRVDPGIVIW